MQSAGPPSTNTGNHREPRRDQPNQRAGFELVESNPHHSFGRDLVGQTWRRALDSDLAPGR
ncbi:hypothetical protein [Nocardia inohanensis]|uniref:hypothetical protein n=1 Tax=Nocardia inohanensis TaxID=209246 RepID=UPI0008338AC8|nr:hypothetical protein [Nocardia inohanensis]